MTMRKVQILFGAVLVCLSVTIGVGATGDETTVSSCLEGATVDQSIPVPADSDLANPQIELTCSSQAADLASPAVMPLDDLGDRAAICLLIPQCSANADCDAQCGGARLGRCVHNPCPARVCRCR